MAWKKRGENSEGGKFYGGTWHIFPHSIEKTYENGEVVDRILWRGVVCTHKDKKLHWKASKDKEIVRRWIKDKIVEFYDFPKPKERVHDEDKKKKGKRNQRNAQKYLQTLKAKRDEERKSGSDVE